MNLAFSKKIKIFSVIMILPASFYLLYGFVHALKAYTCDGLLRWQECACVLRGIYPMDIILGRRSIIAAYGYFDNTATTIPWSYLLSNLFYPGFLPWWAVKIWALFLFVVFAMLCIYFINKLLEPSHPAAYARIFFILILFANFGWGSALGKLNNGMFTVLALLLILLLLEYYPVTWRNDILIASLLVIAMLKPQIALLFYIPLFMQKRIRSIVLSIGIILSAWGIVSLILQVPPLTILLEQFQVGSDLKVTSVYVYYGIFDFLTYFSFSTRQIMLLQFIIFIPLTFFLCYLYRKASLWIQFSIPSTFALFWCYHHNTDLEIIGILMISCAMLLFTSTKKHTKQWIILLLLFNVIPISYAYYNISPIIPFMQRIIYLSGLIILLYHNRRRV